MLFEVSLSNGSVVSFFAESTILSLAGGAGRIRRRFYNRIGIGAGCQYGKCEKKSKNYSFHIKLLFIDLYSDAVSAVFRQYVLITPFSY